VLSIAIHALVLIPGVRKVLDTIDFEHAPEPVIVPMEFTLVSPPQNPIPTDAQSQNLSTISSEARDDSALDPTNDDTPHGEGEIPIPDNTTQDPGEEGGGQSDLPPLPDETASLGEVFKRSKLFEQQSPSEEMSLPESSPDFRFDGSARASIGGIQLSTTAWDFAPYLLDLKHRIKQNWIPPLAFATLGAIHGYTWVRFRIYKDGRTEAIEIVEQEGHKSLHRSSENAVRGAAPFRKSPDHFPDDYLEITFGFYYLLPGDAERYFKERQQRRNE